MTRVLVTGGYGFLGEHLCARLLQEGLSPMRHHGSDFDLTSPEQTERMFGLSAPEVVFHLAAEVGGIGANQANPGRYWYANLAMGMNVLEQARLHRVGKLVMIGTACSYPRDAPLPLREESLWDGYPEETNAPYGIAKRALVTGAQAYRDQYGLNAVSVIPANLYGPGDNFDLETSHVVPALIRKMVDAQAEGRDEVSLWGDGSATRELLFVRDCAQGLWQASRCYDQPGPVNLGSGDAVTIRDLAALIADLVGYQGRILWDHGRPNGQPHRLLDRHRATSEFDFYAETPLVEGLAETVAWYRNHAAVLAR